MDALYDKGVDHVIQYFIAIQDNPQCCNTRQHVIGQCRRIVDYSLYDCVITAVSRTGKLVGFAKFKGASGCGCKCV